MTFLKSGDVACNFRPVQSWQLQCVCNRYACSAGPKSIFVLVYIFYDPDNTGLATLGNLITIQWHIDFDKTIYYIF